ncbi:MULTISPECIES: cold-shock protein [Cohaesibacter]|uniref:cold-shock protein n=1 Tax=Cohaesibacter TaxID=655352 RepID=UPI000DE8077C|nr:MULTISPECIES: cold shock domain-containing protein [Cohaesibacter]TLP43853.1 cold-shock protein [Cohaesibacter sp. CAU 1516]
MTIGTVKFYNSTTGLGVIAPNNGSKEALVHISDIEQAGLNSLIDGLQLSYDLQKNACGKRQAVNLQLTD